MISIVLIIIILLIAGYFFIGNYFYNISLNPKTDKTFVIGSSDQTEEQKQRNKEQLNWLSDNSKDVYINSTKNGNLRLHAYEIERNTNSNAWVLIIHGYVGQASGMTGFAQKFNERGYNVLMIDLRGHGLSEGNYVGMGIPDRLDIVDWINYIVEKNSESKIIIFGISMGAATTMMTTGEKLPNNVKLAIADCGYTSVWDEFSYQLKQLFNLPEFPVLYAANTVCKIRAGYSFKEVSSIEQVKKSTTPTLFIHGDADDFVPFAMLDEIYEAAACNKEKLVVPGATHAMAWSVDTELYWKTIDNFIEKYI